MLLSNLGRRYYDGFKYNISSINRLHLWNLRHNKKFYSIRILNKETNAWTDKWIHLNDVVLEYLNFHNKNEYKEWKIAWKYRYLELSSLIKEAKKWKRLTSTAPYEIRIQAISYLEYLQAQAFILMNIIEAGKEKSHKQYLQSKIPNTISHWIKSIIWKDRQ